MKFPGPTRPAKTGNPLIVDKCVLPISHAALDNNRKDNVWALDASGVLGNLPQLLHLGDNVVTRVKRFVSTCARPIGSERVRFRLLLRDAQVPGVAGSVWSPSLDDSDLRTYLLLR